MNIENVEKLSEKCSIMERSVFKFFKSLNLKGSEISMDSRGKVTYHYDGNRLEINDDYIDVTKDGETTSIDTIDYWEAIVYLTT